MVKGNLSLHPQRAARKKFHSQMPARTRNMQHQLSSDDKSRLAEICHGHNSEAASDSDKDGVGGEDKHGTGGEGATNCHTPTS